MKRRFIGIVFIVIFALWMWSTGHQPILQPKPSSARTNEQESVKNVQSSSIALGIDLKRLPMGDGKISTYPEVGSVWPCRTSFRSVAGAHASGDWIHPDGTYDFTAKPTVDGRVSWPSEFKIKRKKNLRSILGNRLPKDPTGNFPISPNDDAYQYDRNPNFIRSRMYQIDLPATPQMASETTCLPMGTIGILVNGGYLFNALDERGEDAVAHEIQDSCQGHPMRRGTYHYHNITTCVEKEGTGHSELVGYALDGFGIYGHRGEDGKVLTNTNLDQCHGHTHEINWNGKKEKLYHYHATWEYPYTLGCFRGNPQTLAR
jgi:YHYH protein